MIEFYCACCKETFPIEWTEEESLKEKQELLRSTYFKAFDKGRMKRLILDYLEYASKSACSSIVKEQVEEQSLLIEDFLNNRYVFFRF